MTKPSRTLTGPHARKPHKKVTASLDADLYTQFAAGAAELQVSHSRFVADAVLEKLKRIGVYVGVRRSAGKGDSSSREDLSADEA